MRKDAKKPTMRLSAPKFKPKANGRRRCELCGSWRGAGDADHVGVQMAVATASWGAWGGICAWGVHWEAERGRIAQLILAPGLVNALQSAPDGQESEQNPSQCMDDTRNLLHGRRYVKHETHNAASVPPDKIG